ncbi:MAG TPA: SPOR domain-containing protein [Thermoanaerobaculia bacterium]|nr:SPOR domain-containing protein [Thermoanaerobaculia bacterium]
MGEEGRDDSSHYEVSLTATQAFAAFLLLLGSLGAAFAFGIMIGRDGADDRLVVRHEPSVINEGTARSDANRIVELGVNTTAAGGEISASDSGSAIVEGSGATPPTETGNPAEGSAQIAPADAQAGSIGSAAPPANIGATTPPAPSAGGTPFFAQLISTAEAKTAENLAARLIEGGFTSAYVERVNSERGLTYRVRVKFPSEGEARAAVPSLRRFSSGDIWITR